MIYASKVNDVCQWDVDRHFSEQRQSVLWLCGGVWGGWDDSCHLLSRKYTRDPPHSKQPNAHLPFLSTHPLPSSFLQSDRGLFFLASEQFMSSCVGRITSQSCDQCGASILIFGCLCVTRAVFWPERGKGKLCPSAPPSSCQACCKPAKPALRQPARGNLDMVWWLRTVYF